MIVLCHIGKICHMGLVLMSHACHMGNIEAVCLHFTYLGSTNQDDSTVSHRLHLSHVSSFESRIDRLIGMINRNNTGNC